MRFARSYIELSHAVSTWLDVACIGDRVAGFLFARLDVDIGAAKGKGARGITVYTDPLSNWGFYESYGFTRRAAFVDDLNSYLKREEVEGFIYALEIGKT